MEISIRESVFVPQFDPANMSGTINKKIIIKDDYVRTDGTCALYVSIYKGRRVRFPLNIAVDPKTFCKKKQRIKAVHPRSKDLNLIIEKVLSEINKIEVSYRLSNCVLTVDKLIEGLKNPSLRVDFLSFAKHQLEKQKNILKESTYNQQKGALEKIGRFKSPLYFYEIDQKYLDDLKSWMKKKLKNEPATINGTLKNFKKYLHIANDEGIKTKLTFNKISVKKMTGDRTFLIKSEVEKLVEYANASFTKETHRNILRRYLFSCFTGLRISDIEHINEENFINGDILAFKIAKTDKFLKMNLNKRAMDQIELPQVFNGTYSRKTINEVLKEIANTCGIKKRIYFHSSRHTFATNFLASGGRVEVLQKLLGHSDIKETMIYVHITESIKNDQIYLMDDYFS